MAPRIVTPFDSEVWEDTLGGLSSCLRMVMLTGAGISTGCGIPDFRSSRGMNRQTVQQVLLNLGKNCVQHENNEQRSEESIQKADAVLEGIEIKHQRMKCAELFKDTSLSTQSTATALYRLCALLHKACASPKVRPSQMHRFVQHVHGQGRLLGYLTQNIDGIEQLTGMTLSPTGGPNHLTDSVEDPHVDFRALQLHGNLQTVYCRKCLSIAPWTEEITVAFQEGKVLECAACLSMALKRDRENRRSTSPGVIRPNIVLYGEQHPQEDEINETIQSIANACPDMLLIVGTSLSTSGVRKLITDLARIVHDQKHGRVIYINASQDLGDAWDGVIDIGIAMDCEDFIRVLHNFDPVQWAGLEQPIKLQPSLSTRQRELHPRVRRLPRTEQNRVWLDTFYRRL